MAEKLLTIREAAKILEISEKELIKLAEQGIIPAYRIANTHLRFRQDQLHQIRSKIKTHSKVSFPKTVSEDSGYTLREKISDFFYYNDFYIITLAVIVVILFLIFR